MISFPRLGTVGRLGNQLFQIASTIGIARRRHDLVSFPTWDYADYFKVPTHFFSGLPGKDAAEIPKHIDARSRRFLQDLSLWSNVDDEIWHMFQPSSAAISYLEKKYPKFWALRKTENRLISVHVRRGDNASRPNGDLYYPLPTMGYYEEALRQIPEAPIVVFSDEPEWCEKHFVPHFSQKRMMVVKSHTRPETVSGSINPIPALDWTDLILQTFCDYHVIANSTYSWWGAWLSLDNSPIYPSLWYGPEIDYADWRLIIPKNWREVSI